MTDLEYEAFDIGIDYSDKENNELIERMRPQYTPPDERFVRTHYKYDADPDGFDELLREYDMKMLSKKVRTLPPKHLLAREFTNNVTVPPISANSPIAYDIQNFGMRFFVLEHGLGIMPEHSTKIENLIYTVILVPDEIDGGAIHIYDIFPNTIREITSEVNSTLELNGDLHFTIPPLIPGIEGDAGIKGTRIYKMEKKTSNAPIIGTTDHSNQCIWQFQKNKSGEYPLGEIRAYSVIGIPKSKDKPLSSLNGLMKAALKIELKIDGMVFRNNRETEKKVIPIIFSND